MQTNSHLSVLIHDQARKYGNRSVLTFRPFGSLQWKTVTWNQFSLRVKQVSNAMLNLNIKPQENVFGTHTGIKIICRTIEILNDSNHNKIVFEYGPKADATEWESRLVIPRNYNFALPSDRVVNK